MSELPRVKVVNPGDSWIGTEYYINDKKIDRVKAVDFRVAVDEVPTFTFETIGSPDIDMPGDIRFSFTPQTIEEARKIIEHETKNKHRIDLKIHSKGVSSYIDGEYVPACERIEPDNKESIEQIEKMEFIPNKDVLHYILDDIQTDLSKYTRFAMIVLRNELLKHGDLYNGFLASMRSALEDLDFDKRASGGLDIPPDDYEEMPKKILKRLIGEE